jgi:hypothetical protein
LKATVRETRGSEVGLGIGRNAREDESEVKPTVDFLELVNLFDKMNVLCAELYHGIRLLFDYADEFKPQFEADDFSSRFLDKNIYYRAQITDKNRRTNSIYDYRYLCCECQIWIFDDAFRSKISIYGYRGLKDTTTDMERSYFVDLEISEPQWLDLYRNLSSEFQKISLG